MHDLKKFAVRKQRDSAQMYRDLMYCRIVRERGKLAAANFCQECHANDSRQARIALFGLLENSKPARVE